MVRDHNIKFEEIPEQSFDNMKIEINNKVIIDDSNKKIIIA